MGSEPRDNCFHTEGMLKLKLCLHGRIMAGILNGIGKTYSVHTDRSEHYHHLTPSVGISVGLINDRYMKHIIFALWIWNVPKWPQVKGLVQALRYMEPEFLVSPGSLFFAFCLPWSKQLSLPHIPYLLLPCHWPRWPWINSESVTPRKPLFTESLLFQVLCDTNRRLRNTV